MKSQWVKGTLTVVGAIVLSTIGIFASDALQGIDSGLTNLAGIKGAGICKAGSAPLKVDGNTLCVDVYEASPSTGCPFIRPSNLLESEKNASTVGCYAASVKGSIPWNYISLPQAQRMCASAGKRLPTSEEWYHIALGTNPESCVIKTNTMSTTGNESCVSSIGAYDAVGNVWEWVDETVSDNIFEGRALPREGYVTSVDSNGVAVTSETTPDELYGKDYVWTKEQGVFGMIRGGFYNSGDDAGLYALNASILTSFATQGIGFRCVADVL